MPRPTTLTDAIATLEAAERRHVAAVAAILAFDSKAADAMAKAGALYDEYRAAKDARDTLLHKDGFVLRLTALAKKGLAA